MSELCHISPSNPGEQRHLREHVDAHRCCVKLSIGSALSRFAHHGCDGSPIGGGVVRGRMRSSFEHQYQRLAGSPMSQSEDSLLARLGRDSRVPVEKSGDGIRLLVGHVVAAVPDDFGRDV